MRDSHLSTLYLSIVAASSLLALGRGTRRQCGTFAFSGAAAIRLDARIMHLVKSLSRGKRGRRKRRTSTFGLLPIFDLGRAPWVFRRWQRDKFRQGGVNSGIRVSAGRGPDLFSPSEYFTLTRKSSKIMRCSGDKKGTKAKEVEEIYGSGRFLLP